MNMTTQLFISLVLILLCIDVVSSGSYIHPLDDEVYETLKILVEGTFLKRKKDRIRKRQKEKSAAASIWRGKGTFTVRDELAVF